MACKCRETMRRKDRCTSRCLSLCSPYVDTRHSLHGELLTPVASRPINTWRYGAVISIPYRTSWCRNITGRHDRHCDDVLSFDLYPLLRVTVQQDHYSMAINQSITYPWQRRSLKRTTSQPQWREECLVIFMSTTENIRTVLIKRPATHDVRRLHDRPKTLSARCHATPIRWMSENCIS